MVYFGNVVVIFVSLAIACSNADVWVACEGGPAEPICYGGSVISVLSAQYGRNGRQYCNREPIQQLYCGASNSYNIVREMCQDQPSCVVEASNALFGDPCVGTVKYLQVEYECVQATETVATACEGASVTLNCPVGTGIVISSANYGRYGSNTCNRPPMVTFQCSASSSMVVMQLSYTAWTEYR